MDKNINHIITREIAVLSPNQGGWQLELNEIIWNNGRPKLDIRRWTTGRERCSKGTTLTRKEAENLLAALREELKEE